MKGISFSLRDSVLIFLLYASALFFGAVPTWASGALAAFLYSLFLLHSETSLQTFVGLPRFFRYTILILVLFLLSQLALLSKVREATLLEGLKWGAFGCAFLIVLGLPASNVKNILIGLAILGILEALYGLTEVLSGHEYILWRYKNSYRGFVTGTYINRNHFAGLLEISLGILLGWLMENATQKRFLKTAFLFLGCVIAAVGFLKSGSRMALASFAVAFSFSLVIAPGKKISLPFKITLLGLSVLGFFIAGQGLLRRLLDFETWQTSGLGRLEVWRAAFKIIAEHPFVGTGLGTFKWIFPSYQPASVLNAYSHLHQDYLELIVELGVPFALLLFSGFAVWIAACLKRLRQTENENWFLAWGTCLGIMSFLIHSLADFNFAIPANHFAWMLALAGVTVLLNPFRAHE